MKALPRPLTVEVLTVTEAAAILRRDRGALGKAITDGTFECPAAVILIAGKPKIARPILERWLAGEIDGQGQPRLAS